MYLLESAKSCEFASLLSIFKHMYYGNLHENERFKSVFVSNMFMVVKQISNLNLLAEARSVGVNFIRYEIYDDGY